MQKEFVCKNQIEAPEFNYWALIDFFYLVWNANFFHYPTIFIQYQVLFNSIALNTSDEEKWKRNQHPKEW